MDESRVCLTPIEGQAQESAKRAGASAELAVHAAELEEKLRDAVRREAEAPSGWPPLSDAS